jgi:uncharacterized membrane protein YcaP (DUF421 family)
MSPGDLIGRIFGGDEPILHLTWGQVAMRAIAIYLLSIAVVRVGKSRLISRASALDVLLAFVLGSLLSRGITGSASISSTIVASAALVAMHFLLTKIACNSHRVGNLLKGHCRPLLQDGVILHDNLKKSHLSEEDLKEELRLHANCEDISKVKAAYKERSGEISVIPDKTNRIIELGIEEGVKRIRIEVSD